MLRKPVLRNRAVAKLMHKEERGCRGETCSPRPRPFVGNLLYSEGTREGLAGFKGQ